MPAADDATGRPALAFPDRAAEHADGGRRRVGVVLEVGLASGGCGLAERLRKIPKTLGIGGITNKAGDKLHCFLVRAWT